MHVLQTAVADSKNLPHPLVRLCNEHSPSIQVS